MHRTIDQNQYSQFLEKMPICCVDIIVHYKGKVLLLCRNNHPAKGEWYPPGGRVHKHELLEDAAIRKTFEETGLKVKVKSKVGVYETIFKEGPFPELKSGVHTINIVFIAEPIEDNFAIRLDHSNSDYRWVDSIDQNFSDYIKRILKDSSLFR